MKRFTRFSKLCCFIFILIILVSSNVSSIFALDAGRSVQASYVIQENEGKYTYTLTVKNTEKKDYISDIMIGIWYGDPSGNITPFYGAVVNECPEGWSGRLNTDLYSKSTITLSPTMNSTRDLLDVKYIKPGETATFIFTAINRLEEIKIAVGYYNDETKVYGGEVYNGYVYEQPSLNSKLEYVNFKDIRKGKLSWNPDFGEEPYDIAFGRNHLASKGLEITGEPKGFVHITNIAPDLGDTGYCLGFASPSFLDEYHGLSGDEILSIKFLNKCVNYAQLLLTTSPSLKELEQNSIGSKVRIEGYDTLGKLILTKVQEFSVISNGALIPAYIDICGDVPNIRNIKIKVVGKHIGGGIYIKDIKFGSVLKESKDVKIKDFIKYVEEIELGKYTTAYLNSSLKDAIDSVENDNTQKATRQIKDFIRKVKTTSKNHIPDEIKALLTDKANNVISEIK